MAGHHHAGHIVTNHGSLAALLLRHAGGQARALQKGPGLRADETHLFAHGSRVPQQQPHHGFGKTLGHHGGVSGQQPGQGLGAFVDVSVAGLHQLRAVGLQRHYRIASAFQRQTGLGQSGSGDGLHPAGGGGPGVGQNVSSPLHIR